MSDKVAYIEKLTFFSLVSVALSRTLFFEIYFIDRSRNSDQISDIFRILGLISATPLSFEFCFADIKDSKGGCIFFEVLDDVSSACQTIEDCELRSNLVVNLSAERFEKKKLMLFLKKIIAFEIYEPFITIRAVKWHAKTLGPSVNAYLFSQKSLWRSYLWDYAKKHDVVFKCYGFFGRSTYFRSRLIAQFRSFFIKVRRSLSRRGSKFTEINNGSKERSQGVQLNQSTDPVVEHSVKNVLDEKAPDLDQAVSHTTSTKKFDKPMIGALYAGRTITFDRDKRSEFFWLLGSELSKENILLYFQQAHLWITEQMAQVISGNNMNMVAMQGAARRVAGSVPVWKHKIDLVGYLKIIVPLIPRILLYSKRFFFFSAFSYFILKYLYWMSFIKEHNIKINLDPTDFMEANIPLQQAIDDLGGVSVSYHWSNIKFVSIFMSNCADVLFSFGPAYKPFFDKNQSLINSLVYCGYITDHSFRAVKENAQKLRQRLMERGSKFIICFFDENSDDGRTSAITNATTTATYKYFIERMLEDESLGLIFKPGYPRSIYERISPISDLIELARATGRCEFIDGGSHVSEKYPSEAAQAADLSIGLLLSGTVALESYLSGVPTIFLDLEKLYSNPIYLWGRGKVVFNNLDDLFSAIEKYRQSPRSIPGFGDLSKWAEGKDPFKDGQASVRIGQYLNWLLEKFNEGGTKSEAIVYANANYQKEWGISPDSVNSTRNDY